MPNDPPDPRDLVIKVLAAMRIGIGGLAWIRPALAARLFGVPQPGPGQSRYLWRLFGVRDVVLGVGTLNASAASRRTWVTFGVVCDAGDGAAAALGRRSGDLPKSTGALVAVPAVAVALGAAVLAGNR